MNEFINYFNAWLGYSRLWLSFSELYLIVMGFVSHDSILGLLSMCYSSYLFMTCGHLLFENFKH